MKRLLVLTIIMLLTTSIFAQKKLYKTNLSVAISSAKKNKKPIMVYFSLSENGLDTSIIGELLISDKEQIGIYKPKLNIVFINAMDKKHKALLTKYKVKYYPSYVFVNKKGEMIHKRIGALSNEQFNEMVLNVTFGKSTLKYFADLNKSKSKSINNLDYANVLYNAGMPYEETIKKYFKSLKEDEYYDAINFDAFYKYANSADSKEFRFFAMARDYPEEKVSYSKKDRIIHIENVISNKIIKSAKNNPSMNIDDSLKLYIEEFEVDNKQMLMSNVYRLYFRDVTTNKQKYYSVLPEYIGTHRAYLSNDEVVDFCSEIINDKDAENLIDYSHSLLSEIIAKDPKIEYTYLEMQILIKIGKIDTASSLFGQVESNYAKEYNKEWRSKMQKLFDDAQYSTGNREMQLK